MWRVLVASLLIAGCSDPAPAVTTDAAVDGMAIDAHATMRTPSFTMMICASGVPGDSTCPINFVQLDSLGARATGARLSFVLLPVMQDFYLDHIHIEGSKELHMRDVAFEGTAGSAPTILYVEDIDAGTTLGPLPLNDFTASPVLIRVELLY